MISIKEYIEPESLEEAYRILNLNRNNCILGGCGFLKMSSKKINTAIGLNRLELNYIKIEEEELKIGAETSLRELETNDLINHYYRDIISNGLSNIVGIQFRNMAKVGASVFSKYGFSDLLPSLLVLESKVKLYNKGTISLKDFIERPYERDILVEVIIPIKEGKGVFESLRKSSGDFAIINGAMFKDSNGKYNIAIGSRPRRSKLLEEVSKKLKEYDIDKALDELERDIIFGSNIRGSKEYRKDMAKTIIKKMHERIG